MEFLPMRLEFTYSAMFAALLQVGCAHWPAQTAAHSSACCSELPSDSSQVHSSTNSDLLATAWLSPQERTKRLPLDLDLTDQSGRKLRPAALVGKPFAMSFIYTRCTNPNKCAKTADTLSQLQRQVAQSGLTRAHQCFARSPRRRTNSSMIGRFP